MQQTGGLGAVSVSIRLDGFVWDREGDIGITLLCVGLNLHVMKSGAKICPVCDDGGTCDFIVSVGHIAVIYHRQIFGNMEDAWVNLVAIKRCDQVVVKTVDFERPVHL